MIQKRWVLAVLSLIFLAGCFENEPEETRFPPLTHAEIIGCWKMEQPEGLCRVECFDSTGLFFLTSRSDASLPLLAERLGTFRVFENDLFLDFRLKNSQGLDLLSDAHLTRTIQNGRMQAIEGESISNVAFGRVHPDSFPCGMKPWTMFPKPATWTLF